MDDAGPLPPAAEIAVIGAGTMGRGIAMAALAGGHRVALYDPVARALALARTIADMPPLAVRAILQAMKQGEDLPLTGALAEERRAFEALFASADQKEGMSAFLEKRRPVWRAR